SAFSSTIRQSGAQPLFATPNYAQPKLGRCPLFLSHFLKHSCKLLFYSIQMAARRLLNGCRLLMLTTAVPRAAQNERIYLRPNRQILKALDRIVNSGLLGTTRAEVVMYFVQNGLLKNFESVAKTEESISQ
ncbi:MAG: hypothetical protein O3A53_20520, partial [Acidobacteria bacterium]|nr:hypothetical protein [Acidobacteriota bacterium]